VTLGGKAAKSQCASLVLAYSRMLFVQYYPRFTRFEAKAFLTAALQFFDGAARRCVIDNTSGILALYSGDITQFPLHQRAAAECHLHDFRGDGDILMQGLMTGTHHHPIAVEIDGRAPLNPGWLGDRPMLAYSIRELPVMRLANAGMNMGCAITPAY
jgi:hypothetical protein